MSQHRGKGHPAFTDDEIVGHLKQVNLAKTSELAEEYDVSDVAIRKRLKKNDRVEARKIRNRWVWYVPHDVEPVADADGGRPIHGIPPAALHWAGGVLWIVGLISAVLFLGLSEFSGSVSYTYPILAIFVGLVGAWMINQTRDISDPSFSTSNGRFCDE